MSIPSLRLQTSTLIIFALLTSSGLAIADDGMAPAPMQNSQPSAGTDPMADKGMVDNKMHDQMMHEQHMMHDKMVKDKMPGDGSQPMPSKEKKAASMPAKKMKNGMCCDNMGGMKDKDPAMNSTKPASDVPASVPNGSADAPMPMKDDM